MIEGTPGGPLEDEGLTSTEEGSFIPQGPTGETESVHTLEEDRKEDGEEQGTLSPDREEPAVVGGGGGVQEQNHGSDVDVGKVTPNEMLVQMRKMMKIAAKKENDRKMKRSTAKKKTPGE